VSVTVNLQKDLLLDYTGASGSNPTPGSWYTRGKDSGQRPRVAVGSGVALTLNGLYHNGGNYGRYAYFTGTGKRHGSVVFQPDADGKCYFGGSGGNPFNLIQDDGGYLDFVDFTQPAEIVVSSATGSGDLGTGPGLSVRMETTLSDIPSMRIGRTGGLHQVWSSPGTGAGKQMKFEPSGDYWSGWYGPTLVVTASGLEASPNLISFKSGGISGLIFPDNNTGRAEGGAWIEASGTGVARLVLEGDFTTTDNAFTDSLWDMSQIQLQMAGERETGSDQILTWCGADKHAGGTGDLFDFDGLTNANYAIRKLVIGSDEGTDDNYVTFDTSASGSAIYTWGLELKPGGYLTIANADDYIYYLGDGSEAAGITGGGLVGNLDTQCNRPENVFMLGEIRPPPGTIVIVR
jgi:hypothetical protein